MTLKIQKSIDGCSCVLSLSGQFEAQHIAELQKLKNSGTRNVILDLEELILADRECIEFLARSEAEGVEIKNCSQHIREWISKTKLNL